VEKSCKEIVAEAERLDVKDKAVLGLSELLFDKNMVNQIPKFRALFLRVSFVITVIKALGQDFLVSGSFMQTVSSTSV